MPNKPYRDDSCCGCFGLDTMIQTEGGDIMGMKTLKEGEKVLSFGDDKEKVYTELYVQTHMDFTKKATFCEISTFSRRLNITPRHFIVVKDADAMIDKMAKDVEVGDVVFTLEDGKLIEEAVMSTDMVEGTGFCNFFTTSGRLIADGFLCSCYAEVKPSLVHPVLAPLRTAYNNSITKGLVGSLMKKNEEGKPYIFKAVSSVLSPLIK